jgi:hypothetical protein
MPDFGGFSGFHVSSSPGLPLTLASSAPLGKRISTPLEFFGKTPNEIFGFFFGFQKMPAGLSVGSGGSGGGGGIGKIINNTFTC